MRRSLILRTPPQGWISLFAFVVMLAIVGFAIASSSKVVEAGLVDGMTLPVLMVAAGLVGYVLARSGIGIVRSHVIGATTAAIILIPVVGSAVPGSDGQPLVSWLIDIDGLGPRMADLAARIRAEPTQATEAALLLILGAICWTTGQFGASAIFRFDRGLPAVAAAGVPLFVAVILPDATVNIVLTLALFTFFAMLLLIRMQLRHQRDNWARRHIADAGEVSRLFMRSGVLFVAFTVLSASTLTGASQRADLGSIDLSSALPRIDVPEFLRGLIGTPVDTPGSGFSLKDPEAPQADDWVEDPGWAFTSREGNPTDGYWWVAAWDTWNGSTFTRTEVVDSPREASAPLPLPVHDRRGRGLVDHTIIVGDMGLASSSVVAPSEPILIDRATTVSSIGTDGSRMLVEFPTLLAPDDEVTVSSLSLDYSEDTDLTEAALREAANRPLPADIEARYIGTGNAALGPRAQRFADEVRGELEADGAFNAYDAARLVEARFLTEFDYEPEMAHLCLGTNQTECVFEFEQGFCTFFAQTMTIVMQSFGFPSRYVWGYLPGPDQGAVPAVVDNAWLHAWVEVYLDGFGWVRFDPTPGGRFGQARFQPPEDTSTEEPLEPLPSEAPAPTAEATETAVIPPPPADPPPAAGGLIPFWDELGAIGRASLLLSVTAALFLLLAALASVRLLRLPGGDPSRAYGGIVALATRFGHGPRPAQTELEYASALAERIPAVDDEVRLVVDAHVEAAYADPAAHRRQERPLGRAYARVRTALLRMRLGR